MRAQDRTTGESRVRDPRSPEMTLMSDDVASSESIVQTYTRASTGLLDLSYMIYYVYHMRNVYCRA
jgi:hypothetical protein